MTISSIKDRYQGAQYVVIHCDGALESFKEALKSLNSSKRESLTRQMILQIERLANGERMSKESFPPEGDLPKKKGQHKAKKFYALKRIPIRGYCWLSEKHLNTYFISHYIYKDYARLSGSDTAKVGANWWKIEDS